MSLVLLTLGHRLTYLPMLFIHLPPLEDLIKTTPCFQEALKWVTDQPAWQRSEGRDHVIPVHHPWSFKSVRRFVKKAIWLLPDMDSTGNWYGIQCLLPLYLVKLLAC